MATLMREGAADCKAERARARPAGPKINPLFTKNGSGYFRRVSNGLRFSSDLE
jgi:hypothetical protein